MFTSPVNPHETLKQLKSSQTLVHDLAREFLGALSESSALMERHVKVMTSILDSLTVGLVVVDAQNHLVLTNAKAITLGVDPDSDWMTQLREHFEFRYSEDGELVPPGTGPAVRAMIEKAPQQAEVFVTCDHEMAGRWFKISSAPIIDSDGTLQGAVTLFNEVTEQTRLRKELEALDTLMTHDIKNHFAAVEGVLDFMHNDPATSLSPDSLCMLNELRLINCDQLQSLNNLVHLRTAGANSQSMIAAPVHVKTLVESAHDLVEQLAAFRSIQVSVDIDKNLPELMVPQVAMLHVLSNLMHNAIKYSEPHDTVCVSAYRDQQSVTIVVSDNGPGMNRQELANLFKPKLKQSGKGARSFSSGLGLYLCRQVVNASGGRLSCESESAKGTKFFLSLPATGG